MAIMCVSEKEFTVKTNKQTKNSTHQAKMTKLLVIALYHLMRAVNTLQGCWFK